MMSAMAGKMNMTATANACSGGVGIFETSGYGPGPIVLSVRVKGLIANIDLLTGVAVPTKEDRHKRARD
jgi:hypothetical protein